MREIISMRLRTLLGSYHPNSWEPEHVKKYVESISNDGQLALKVEMQNIIKNKVVDKENLGNILSDDFASDASARNFFSALYEHIFEDKDMPDIDKYLA